MSQKGWDGGNKRLEMWRRNKVEEDDVTTNEVN